jgi:hypothetical protein
MARPAHLLISRVSLLLDSSSAVDGFGQQVDLIEAKDLKELFLDRIVRRGRCEAGESLVEQIGRR